MRIVTWNVAGCRTIRSAKQFDYYEGENRQYFAERISALKPDVVCLQETHGSRSYSLATELAKEIGLPHVFEKRCCPSHIDRRYKLCNAILSREPFTDPQAKLLPRPPFQLYLHGKPVPPFDRYLISVQFPGFRVATLHVEPLDILGYDYSEGLGLKFGHMIDKVLVEQLKPPFVFTADLYAAHPTIPFPKFMSQRSIQDVLPAQVPTDPKGLRPDHIMCTPEWLPIHARVIPTQTDHFLCVADLQPDFETPAFQ